jgi:stage III sporulation protein AG
MKAAARQLKTIARGGTREINEIDLNQEYVLLRDAGGSEKPLLISENMPRLSGILVVAQGMENSLLRLRVVRAIQSLLDLPVHRIAVLPRGDN